MDLGLGGKRVLVTGGSSGIGRACALELAREGSRVAIVARGEQRLASVAAEIEQLGSEGIFIAADLSTEAGCRAAIEACRSAWGGIDILVNNAGSAPRGHVLRDLSEQIIKDALRLKLHGYLRLAQMAFPDMQVQRWGRVINIAGAAGTSPTATNLAAGFANAGVLNLTRDLARAGAAHGILVNAICPGLTDTPRARETRAAAAVRAGRPMTEEEIEADIAHEAASTPAGRPGWPEEIARVVCFLASEACSRVQASAIYMDGGARRAGPSASVI
jgi:3-oxoacyl-[acyl-carrier protein] reductase